MFRAPVLRQLRAVPRSLSAIRTATTVAPTTTASPSAHPLSNPTLANIEKRWENMPPQEQAELWMALRDRMTASWKDLTLQEKKAAYWIAFGPHGPRAGTPPGEGLRVFYGVLLGLGATTVIFGLIRALAGPAPATMTKEYQEATNEYLKGQNSEPITGISSEGYRGPGYVQSKPAKPQ